ncbi:MAG: LysM peptidoglycan-binding domain-containing protein [Anaerolineales bacterium]|nr:LysM peptidoglycan-binding domain-containing protein [Anaerolineales bacterium]
MNRKVFAVLAVLTFTLAVFAGALMPVSAAPALQLTPFPTPTPGLDGRIIYQVQADDTLWRISAVSGVPLDELRQLNSLDVDAVIRPGQVLLLGVVEPPAVTLEPGAAQDPATLPTPTPTALADASAICVLLYLDENGDAIRQEQEIALADGEVSVTERLGAYSQKQTTTFFDEPVCFENIPPGEYLVTMALPGGFNRTTELSVTVELVPGDTSYLNFGTQPTEAFEPLTEQLDTGDGGGGSGGLVIAVVGAGLLLAGVGVGVWAVISNKRRFSAGDD